MAWLFPRDYNDELISPSLYESKAAQHGLTEIKTGIINDIYSLLLDVITQLYIQRRFNWSVIDVRNG